MDRRQFLRTGGFLTASVAIAGISACGSGDVPPSGVYVFSEGIASGDPRSDSIVLWTRVRRADDGRERIAVSLHLATDSGFSDLLVDTTLTAVPEFDYTLRHKVTGLTPGAVYYYRFTAGGDSSPVGRTRTAPPSDANIGSLRFACVSCQDYSVNHWEALDALAEEDIDFVLHLGDYIYETVGGQIQRTESESSHPALKLPDGYATPDDPGTVSAVSLNDYRYLYRSYRSDPRLQKVHARFPMIVIWDDHEFTNDCWQDHETYTSGNEKQTARRRNASQAWFEYMPADVSFDAANPDFRNITIYRDFQFGRLAHLVVTDERLYRSDHVIAEDAIAPGTGPDPSAASGIGSRHVIDREGLARAEAAKLAAGTPVTMLGDAQENWWKSKLAATPAQWKLWGNEVSLLRMQIDLKGLLLPPFDRTFILNADQWDGYNHARKTLLAFVRERRIRNVIALSGDAHAFFAGYVLDDFDSAEPAAVIADIVTAGVSSTPFFYHAYRPAQTHPLLQGLSSLIYTVDQSGNIVNTLDDTLKRMNPWIVHADTRAIGYTVVTVQKDHLLAELKKFAELPEGGTLPRPALIGVTRVKIAADTGTITVEPGAGP